MRLQPDDPFSVAAFALVVVMTIVMFLAVPRLYHSYRHEDAATRKRITRRVLVCDGVWLVSLGLLLIAGGAGASAVGPIGAGAFLAFGGHYGVLTGEWLDRQR